MGPSEQRTRGTASASVEALAPRRSLVGVIRRTSKRVWFLCNRCKREADAPVETQRSRLLVCRQCFGRGKDKRPRELNDLSGAEWAKASKSIEAYPDTRSPKQRAHGACFSQALASAQIAIYTRKGEVVLDPFVGVGTTLDAAVALGRRAIGIDINDQYVSVARKDLEAEGFVQERDFRLYVGDAAGVLGSLPAECVDFLLTSPPYSTLLKSVKGTFAYKWREHSLVDPVPNPRPYSDRPQDLGNMPYEDYLRAVEGVFKASRRVLRTGSYSVWVVKDFRDMKHNVPYANLHGDIIGCAERGGLVLWDIRIYDQTRFRPLVCLGFPSRKFYLNIGHSYILVFRKLGDRFGK